MKDWLTGSTIPSFFLPNPSPSFHPIDLSSLKPCNDENNVYAIEQYHSSAIKQLIAYENLLKLVTTYNRKTHYSCRIRIRR